MKEIKTDKAPQAVGPYSQAVFSNGFLFCSGQIPLHPETGELVQGDIKSQTKQVLENMKRILGAAELDMGNIVRMEIYLVNIDDFKEVNEVYETFFNHSLQPARVTVGVAALPKGASVEMSCIAKK